MPYHHLSRLAEAEYNLQLTKAAIQMTKFVVAFWSVGRR